ncbi:tryptophan synthase subunit alpha [Alkalihalobacillus sp. AL-G]|uniref:tryptophan synthase subunit alpha n=1 Tax=Alkalihalobacillus sp. AL-G TaxID=2926399 RepID=UPI00272C477B|nr:tryptophan synthase subunit alpha [Alkalihalobacillus sp. AL-G]WLD91820.1 tryptophan synthase subunit alpha [Alkalihalobacillus sp. AL-G]
MNRFDQIRNKKEPIFIPFLMAGDPTEADTIDLALLLQEEGADVLEIGIPYSDPLADGPVIQEAAKRALKGGMNLEKAMKMVGKMRKSGLHIPIVLFTYYNLLLQLGQQHVIDKMNEYGIDGLLVPDLPFEESESLRNGCKDSRICCISLVAPTTSPERLIKISQNAEGFLYCVSSLGVTGERNAFHPEVQRLVQEAKFYSNVPVALGFGISSREQFEEVSKICDGVIIGSSLIRKAEELQSVSSGMETENWKESFKSYVGSLLPSKSSTF